MITINTPQALYLTKKVLMGIAIFTIALTSLTMVGFVMFP
jgi:hypothetical protein